MHFSNAAYTLLEPEKLGIIFEAVSILSSAMISVSIELKYFRMKSYVSVNS